MAIPTKEDALKGLDNPMIEPMETEGIDTALLAKKLKEELEADETKVFNPKGNKGKAGLIYSKDLIAWPIRQKARQDAHKLRGDYPSDKLDVDLEGDINLHVIYDDALKKDEKEADET